MYEYCQILHRLRQGQSARSIARDTGFGRNKIKEINCIAINEGWLDISVPLPELNKITSIFSNTGNLNNVQNTSKIAPYKDLVEQWFKEGIAATTIHHHLVKQYQYTGAYNSVQRYMQQLKNIQLTDLTVPLIFKAGEAVQVDFGKGPPLYDQRIGKVVDTWFFVMTQCWSRHQYAELITHQDIETWLQCHQNAFEWFGGVAKKIIIDNPKCAITKACYHSPEVQRSYEALAQAYGFIISACPPREPKKKGRVESGVKYIKRAFLPLQDFKSLQDANQKLKSWILSVAGNRTHGSTFEKPLTRFNEIEKYQLKALPKTSPEIAIWQKAKLYRDCHVRFKLCRYSAPYHLYNEELWLKVTATTVAVYHEEIKVALHSRLFKAGEFSTKHEHLPPNARYYLQQDESWCLAESKNIGEHCQFVIENALTHPTTDLLRQAQKIISLKKSYGVHRLELACRRARAFSAMNYKTIKTILQEGLEYEVLKQDEAFDELSAIYKGKAQYQRNLINSIH